MPIFRPGRRSEFPPPELADEHGLLAIGGDLSIERLLAAYRRGIFPWSGPGEPILWWCPDPRLILVPDRLHVSRSLRATIRKGIYRVRFDTAFTEVIRACATTPRREGPGTWITREVERAYTRLHELGLAHSVESWHGDALAGGLYGVELGRCFFGESMFARETDASKVALVALVEKLKSREVGLIDCQVTTEHLLSLGAEEIPRTEFLRRLEEAMKYPDRPGSWSAS
jgi:leucyl/phenylalanyl-tRNA--protein transferase